jgi:glycine betaine/proline transport system ATP-binding protein
VTNGRRIVRRRRARRGGPDVGAEMLRCDGLWKVFGTRAASIVGTPLAALSREQLLADTGSLVAVRDVSLSVATGELFVIMGLSGSGKSTLVRCLGRLLDPTAGRIAIAGEDVTEHGPTELRALRRDVVSMVFQHFGLLPNRRVLDNVAYGLEIQGVDRARRHARAREVIELVGLGGFAEHRPEALSGGMQQRVGLARALANDPKLLLLDEPFSALDPLTRRDMQEEVLRLQERTGTTMVFITHDVSEALRLGDRIALMRDGDVVQVGTPADLLTRPADDYVRDFTRDAPRDVVLTAGDVCVPMSAEGEGADLDGAAVDVHADTTLRDLLPTVATGRRLRVVDGERVLGTVEPGDVLAALYGRPLSSSEDPDGSQA